MSGVFLLGRGREERELVFFFFFFFCAFFCSLLFVFEVQTTDAAMEMLRMGFLVVLSERLLLLLVLEVTKGREAGREGKVLLLV